MFVARKPSKLDEACGVALTVNASIVPTPTGVLARQVVAEIPWVTVQPFQDQDRRLVPKR